MTRVTNATWTAEQNAKLIKLAEDGASVIRIAAGVKRTVAAVRARARILGIDIRTSREIRSRMRMAENKVQYGRT